MNMDLSIVAILIALAVICVVLVMMPRTLLLATLEIFCAGFGLFAVIAPRKFLEVTFIPKKAAKYNETDEVFLACLGVSFLQLSMLSFLTRRSSNDESVLRSLMSMWMRVQVVLAIDSVHNLIKDGTSIETTGKGADKKTVSTFDINTVPKGILSAYLWDVTVLVAIVVVMIRWPSFKVKVTMSSANRVHKYFLLDQILVVMFATMDLMYPEYFLKTLGSELPTTSHTLPIIRLRAALLLMTAVQNQAIQNYYSVRDKLPYFKTNLICLAITVIFLFSRALPGTSVITVELCVYTLIAISPCIVNQVLGFVAASKLAEDREKDC